MTTVMLVLAAALGAAPEDSTLKIDAVRVVNRTTPLMYGSCIEDVNHEIYGGLYAQMIFGESFEEPPRTAGVAGWSIFGGHWSPRGGVFAVEADLGAKAVRATPILTDGAVACDVRLVDDKGDNAGLIVRVREPRVGPDDWTGYEISISVKHQHLLLGRHHNNWQPLKAVPAAIVAGRWYRLRVELAGATIRVFLDDAKGPAISVTDAADPIASGMVGVRTWGSNAEYRNLVIDRPEGQVGDQFTPVPDDPASALSGAWDVVRTGDAVPRLTWDADRPFNSARAQRIERVQGGGTVGVANRGLNRRGLTVRQDHDYAGRLYLRQEGLEGHVVVALQSADGARTYATETLGPIDKDWGVQEFTLTPDATDSDARFALWVDGPGAVWVDQVYLSATGDDLFQGLPMRADIGRALQREGLTVLRYGGSMVNAPGYRWKAMIGDRDRRPQYKGWWYPHSTNGFGIEDFVRFCRAAGFEAIFAINIEETPEDAADLVDYLNGPVTTAWGRRRAENGHPAAYNVRLIEIGNEEGTTPHYIERFQRLYAAMRPRDPKLEFIVGAWWEPDNPVSRRIITELAGKAGLWDVHVGGDDPKEGAKVDALFSRMRKLIAEWAPGSSWKACVLEENGGRHDLARALGHASVLNATQRHGDFVLIDCPANCLQPWRHNDNGWDQGQLFFTSGQVWGMPPYSAQQMAARAHLPCRVASETTSPHDDLDLTATRDDAGSTLVLKVVNASATPHRAAITLDGFTPVDPRVEVVTLAGALNDRNTPDDPDHIQPVRSTLDTAAAQFTHEFPAHSYTILRLRKR